MPCTFFSQMCGFSPDSPSVIGFGTNYSNLLKTWYQFFTSEKIRTSYSHFKNFKT